MTAPKPVESQPSEKPAEPQPSEKPAEPQRSKRTKAPARGKKGAGAAAPDDAVEYGWAAAEVGAGSGHRSGHTQGV